MNPLEKYKEFNKIYVFHPGKKIEKHKKKISSHKVLL